MSRNYVTFSGDEPCPAEFVKEECISYDYGGDEGDISSNEHINFDEHPIKIEHTSEQVVGFQVKKEEDYGEVNSFETVFLHPDNDISVADVNAVDPLAVKKEEETGHEVVFEMNSELFPKETSQYAGKYVKIDAEPFKCQVCKKIFTKSSGVISHMTVPTVDREYKCYVCNMCLASPSKLTWRSSTYISDNSYKCDICNKCFTSSSGLSKHWRRHLGYKPHECEVCGKSFVSASELTLHRRRRHLGDKPHKCDVCNKCFTTSYDLTLHKWRHTERKE